MSNEYVQQSQSFAVSIEHSMCKVFECDRYGFGGMVNSDEIRKHPYLSMTQALAYLYALLPNAKEMIENFVEHFSFYQDMSIDEILSFDTNEKSVDKGVIQIEKENGLELLEYMIDEFDNIVEKF